MLRKLTPGVFSLIIVGLFLLSIAVVLQILSLWKHFETTDALLILLFSIILFLIVRFLVARLIFRKFETLFRIIGEDPEKATHYIKEPFGSPALDKVKEDVQNWTTKKHLEIRQLKQMEKYRREFLGNVSHELKTPIFNIQGYILTLLDGGLEDPSVNRLYLERSEKSINRLISIVKDLESISRLESGTLQLQLQPVDILQLTEEVLENLELRAKQKNITLTVRKPVSGTPVLVLADRKRIYEVLSNLLTNSISYGKVNGKTTISFRDRGTYYRIIVADNGIGIPPEDQHRIFERFYRVDQSRSRNLGGTGLGLAIVKHIIEAHGQQIRVKSTPGIGTEFSFTLKKAWPPV